MRQFPYRMLLPLQMNFHIFQDTEGISMVIIVYPCHITFPRSFWISFQLLLLLLLLSRFSRVRLCATPQTAAHQAPPSLGFSRQEHWSGLPFPSPMRESEVAQSCPTLSDPVDGSLPGSSVHGVFQARVLEWGAIGFSLLSTNLCLVPIMNHKQTPEVRMT